MNDAQNLFNTGGSDLNQTQPAQTNNSQGLVAPDNNLQTTNGTVLSQDNLKITSVGSSSLDTVNVNTTNATIATKPNTDTSSANPLLIGMAIMLFIFALLIFWVITKGAKQSTKSK